jgi:hypothetical protein
MYHPTPIGGTCTFCFCYINQLPVVEWIVPKNVVMYHPTSIGGTHTFFFVIYQSTACSGVYPKVVMYHPTSIRGNLHSFFMLYQSTACSGVYRTQKCYYVSSNADWSDPHFLFFVVYESTACIVEWIVPKMLLCIIQRRSEQIALFV